MEEQQQKDLIKKTKIKMWVGLVLIIVVGLAIAVYFVFINPIEKDDVVINTNTIANENTNKVDTSNWLTFENEEYEFSFKYPGEKRLFGNFLLDNPEKDTEIYVGSNDHGFTDLYIKVVLPDFYIDEVKVEVEKPLSEYSQYVWELNKNDNNISASGKEVGDLKKVVVGENESYTFTVTKTIKPSSGSGFVITKKSNVYLFSTDEYKILASFPVDNQIGVQILETLKFVSNDNTNTITSSDKIKFPEMELGISCTDNEDCIIVDKTESVGDCCPTLDCINWYVDDNYVSVNAGEFYDYALDYKDNYCSAVSCPEMSAPYCPPGNSYADADCQDNVCVKVKYGTGVTLDWQTYQDKVNGYTVMYPGDYLIKMDLDGYVIFDPVSMDTPDTTYLAIIVDVEDNDFHTHRLGILTNSAVQSDTVVEEDVTIDGLSGKKITYKTVLSETMIHYIVDYLGKVYDISAGDSVPSETMDNVVANFKINQLFDTVDIADPEVFTGQTCLSNNDCGAYPCYENVCLVQACTNDSECSAGTCGQYVTPVPGYCTTMDSL